jgi:diamine N-acetyltransferase
LAVRVEPITTNNRHEAITLEIADEQRAFVENDSIRDFLAEAPSHPTFTPHVIYADDATVGFVSYGYLPEQPRRWWIALLIIDRRQQGKGYGRAAMTAVIDRIKQQVPDCLGVGLSYKPTNVAAERLYLSLGFEKTGETDERGEIYLWLPVASSN